MSTLFKRLPYIFLFLFVFLFVGAKQIKAVLVCDPTCYYGSSQCSARITPRAGYTCQRADAKCVNTCNTATGEWCWAFCANLTPTNTPRPPTATPIPPTNTPRPPTATPTPAPHCEPACGVCGYHDSSGACHDGLNGSWIAGNNYCCQYNCSGTCNYCRLNSVATPRGVFGTCTPKTSGGENAACVAGGICPAADGTYCLTGCVTIVPTPSSTPIPTNTPRPTCAGTVASCGTYPTCNICSADGWYVMDTHQGCNGNQLCTYDHLEFRDYSCTSQTCTYTVSSPNTTSAYRNCSVCPSGVCLGSACTAVSTATPIPGATNTPVPSATPTPTTLPAPASVTVNHYPCPDDSSSCPKGKYFEVIQWAAVTGANSYRVYRCLGTSCVMDYLALPLTTTGAGITNYTDYNGGLGLAYLWSKPQPFSFKTLFFRQAHAQAGSSISYEVKAVSAGGVVGLGRKTTDILPAPGPTPTPCETPSDVWNFTYTTAIPGWFQTTGGDIHSKGVISVLIPSCSTTDLNFSENGDGGSPGIVTWEGTSNQVGVGPDGQVSSTNWQAKPAPYTEPVGFAYLVNSLKVERVNNMGDDCSDPSNNCKVPEASGTYYVIAPEVVIKEGADIEVGNKVVVFVDGNATISKKDITVEEGGFFALIASGDITFAGSASDYVTKAQGFFLADGQIITEAGDKSFEGQGSFVALGGFDFNRVLADNCAPAETFIERPDMFINAPASFTLSAGGFFQEVAP